MFQTILRKTTAFPLILSLLAIAPMLFIRSADANVPSASSINSPASGEFSFIDSNFNALFERNLSTAEARKDFAQMADAVRNLYGPLEYKERLHGFSFEQWVTEIDGRLALAKNDAAVFSLFSEFLSKFEDGHVGIRYPFGSGEAYGFSAGIFIVPVEDKAIVAQVRDDRADTRIKVGDEITLVDGKPVFDYLPIIKKYSAVGNDKSELHFIYKVFSRSFFEIEMLPKKNTVDIVLRKPDGTELTEELTWNVSRNPGTEDFVRNVGDFTYPGATEMKAAAEGSLMQMGAERPFFATPEVEATYNLIEVKPSQKYRSKYELESDDKPGIYAALYNFNGKNALLIRQPGYGSDGEVEIKYYKAIMDQFDDIVDYLIVDQNHNPGGSYCGDFFRLFIKGEKNYFVQALNVDRQWINALRVIWPEGQTPEKVKKYREMADQVEAAYDAGDVLTKPVPLMDARYRIEPSEGYHWSKPMLVLADELAGSCGDIFPMLIKRNGIAKIFGQKTMGLGGNVESAGELTYSRASFRLTRGLYTTNKPSGNYVDEDFVENRGIEPDFLYDHTVDDFRAGFTGYFKAFNETAVKEIH